MLQDKRAEEEGGKEGNRPSQIGQVKRYTRTTQGAVRWGIEGSLATGKGAEAACSGVGAALTQLGRGQNTGGTTRAVQPVFSRTLLRRCRRLHRASARHRSSRTQSHCCSQPSRQVWGIEQESTDAESMITVGVHILDLSARDKPAPSFLSR